MKESTLKEIILVALGIIITCSITGYIQYYTAKNDYDLKIVLDMFLKFKSSIDYYQLKSKLYKLKNVKEHKDEDLEQLQINNSNIQFYISVIKKSSPSCDISSCESSFLKFKEKFNNINSDHALLDFFKDDEFVDKCNKFIENKIPKIKFN